MSAILHRLRSALVLGILWGVAWLPVGVTLAVSKRWLSFPFGWIDWVALGAWTGLAVVSGATFALLLASRERAKTLESLAARRVLAWGTLAGAGVPIAFSAVLLTLFPNVHLAPDAYSTFALMGATGAASAVLTIALAKRGREHVERAAPPT